MNAIISRRSTSGLLPRSFKERHFASVDKNIVQYRCFDRKNYENKYSYSNKCFASKRDFTSNGAPKEEPSNVLRDFVLPPRSSSETISSAFLGAIDLIKSQKSRDVFVGRANDNIIQPMVLGIPLSFALHHELDNKLLGHFDDAEFMEGVKQALQNFQTVKTMLHNDIIKENRELREVQALSSDTKQENVGSDTKIDEIIESDMKPQTAPNLTTDVLNSVQKDADENVDASPSRWEALADADDQSLASILRKMVSPDYFKFMELDLSLLLAAMSNQSSDIFGDTCEVSNAVLVSARAIDVSSETDLPYLSGDDIETNKNENVLKAGKSNYSPVAAQIEVLFSVSFDYIVQPRQKPSVNDNSLKEERQSHTNLCVGTFKGWLNGDPEENELRW
eukprot:CAMPEP_0194271112 /NCGR_PEP_ID=MMETSP0169-20130528/4977_1 /TAXON_ID=218684 /ORGANISM="Corethron pennatum, Strain L29A3" /LENGTH=391 /DNA_ID=CAMNT_0039013389 /DNA_START=126 /DNA_END=1298 /DNA_ORIENTATION=-